MSLLIFEKFFHLSFGKEEWLLGCDVGTKTIGLALSDIALKIAKAFQTIHNLMGDLTILRAMRTNEIDTTTAYGRINNYEDIPKEIRGILKQGLEDERRHLVWLEETLEDAV